MRRLFAAFLASLILAGLLVPVAGVAGAAAPAAAANAVPKVVIVVGPSGGATDRYRREARSAAALARKYTPDVTELYSPNATWPAVRDALQGASVVIYMGHGNGWPSKYRNNLYGPTQNGFGLNPSANGNDHEHQYFGESRIAADVDLAKNAVVLLNHLCYASGNTEPGLAEGTFAQARQRVDNYAAGFIKAGAAAVIAEAYASPNHMLKVVLGGGRSIESAWRGAPSRNGNFLAFPSERSAGYVAQMDPERGTSGFRRSMVLKAGLASADVLANARGSRAASPVIDAASLVPSLASAGLQMSEPTIADVATVDTKLKYWLHYEVANRKELPKKLMASVRWDALDPVATDPATEVTAEPAPAADAEATATPAADASPAAAPEEAAASAEPSASSERAASAAPEASEAPEATEAPAETPERAGPPDLNLVTPERLGDVVEPVKVSIGKSTLQFKVASPSTPGRYRLTVTLHDADGVAYDAGTQAMLPNLIVRVTGDLDAQVIAPSRTELGAGDESSVEVWVANLGKAAWGHAAIHNTKDPDASAPATAASVSGQWVALGSDADAIAAAAAAGTVTGKLPAGHEPGAVIASTLDLVAPTVTGEYLLLLDVLTPDHGSLVATGVEPTVIRVSVVRKPAEPVAATKPTAPPEAAAEPSPEADPAVAGDPNTSRGNLPAGLTKPASPSAEPDATAGGAKPSVATKPAPSSDAAAE